MKPTKEQMQDESKWIRRASRNPSEHGFYAVRLQPGSESYCWLLYDGRWTHGRGFDDREAEKAARRNASTGHYLRDIDWLDMAWFQIAPGLFD